MAPPKRMPQQPSEEPQQPSEEPPPIRLTRAAAKRAADAAQVEQVPEKKKAKKGKGVAKKKKDKKENEAVLGQNKSKEEKEEGVDASENVLEDSNNKKTIVVEHCKQCNQFKVRANMVKEGLEKAGCGITVILNPEKPRRGCFEIRQEGGKKFITLLDMKRPFKPMKDLDMNKVITDIVDEMSKTN